MTRIFSLNINRILYGITILVCLLLIGLQNSHANPRNEILDSKFKALHIIKMAGIAPPADENLKDMEGKSVNLSDYKGKIVFLNFWTTWCPDCKYEMPDIEKLHQTIKDPDFIILAIDLRESSKKVKKYIRKYDLSFKILLDRKGNAGRAFGIRSIPTTFILNRQGGLIGKAMGAREWGAKKSIDLFHYLLTQDR